MDSSERERQTRINSLRGSFFLLFQRGILTWPDPEISPASQSYQRKRARRRETGTLVSDAEKERTALGRIRFRKIPLSSNSALQFTTCVARMLQSVNPAKIRQRVYLCLNRACFLTMIMTKSGLNIGRC